MSQEGKYNESGTIARNTLFLAYLFANTQFDATGDGTIFTVPLNAKLYDIANNFSTATSTFTAPANGKYFFSALIYIGGLAATHTTGTVSVVTSNRTFSASRNVGAQRDSLNQCSLIVQGITDFDVGDTAFTTCQVSGGAKVVDVFRNVTTAQINMYFAMKRIL